MRPARNKMKSCPAHAPGRSLKARQFQRRLGIALFRRSQEKRTCMRYGVQLVVAPNSDLRFAVVPGRGRAAHDPLSSTRAVNHHIISVRSYEHTFTTQWLSIEQWYSTIKRDSKKSSQQARTDTVMYYFWTHAREMQHK
jgi:hypothetical protein